MITPKGGKPASALLLTTLALLLASALALAPGATPSRAAPFTLTDNFAGTTIDPAKWQVFAAPGASPGDWWTAAFWQQADDLQLTAPGNGISGVSARSTPRFTQGITTYEVETWLDSVAGGIQFLTPYGGLVRDPAGQAWLALWTDSLGTLRQATIPGLPTLQVGTHYKLKLLREPAKLSWQLDLGGGSGFQTFFSTSDFRFPFSFSAPVYHVYLENVGAGTVHCDNFSASGNLDSLAEGIVLTSDAMGNRDLWAFAVSGGSPIQITSNSGYDDMASPSPPNRSVGTRIAYVSDVGSTPPEAGQPPNTNIFLFDPATQSSTRLTNETTAFCSQPRWSQDGAYIVYAKKPAGAPAQVWRVQTNAGSPGPDVQLTSEVADHRGPKWVSGYLIVYEKRVAGAWEVWRMNPDGSGQVALAVTHDSIGSAPAHGGSRPASTSPTTQVAYDQAASLVSEIRSVFPDASGERLIHDNSPISPGGWGVMGWSPDDARLAASVFPLSGSPFNPFVQILNSASGAEVFRTPSGSTNEFSSEGSDPLLNPRFSAGDHVWNESGTKLVYMSDRDGDFEIYSVNADGTGETRLTTFPSTEENPAFFPLEPACGLPAAPALTAPGNGATGVSLTATLTWAAVTGATAYGVQISTASDFSTLAVDASATTNSLVIPGGALVEGQAYFWRVRSFNECGAGSFSAAFGFSTRCADVPPAPTLASPADGATIDSIAPLLNWGDVTGATGYTVQVATDSSFSDPVVNTTTTTSQFQVTGLGQQTTYFWRASATNTCGDGPFSTARTFSTGSCPLPAAPTLTSPSDGSSTEETAQFLNWGSVAGATSYRIQISTSFSFSTTLVDTTTTSSQYLATGLQVGLTYFWRVSATNGCGDGPFSSVRSFSVTACSPPFAPILISPAEGATVSLTPTLDWTDVSGATGYQVYLDIYSDFESSISFSTTSSSFTIPSGMLFEDYTFYWRVAARNSCGQGFFSSTRSFDTAPLTAVFLHAGVNQFALPLASETEIGGRMAYPCDQSNLLNQPLPLATWSNPAGAYTYGTATDLLTPGLGYFVEVANNENCIVTGTPFAGGTDLRTGWNLIGAPARPTSVDFYHGDCSVVSGPWRWDTVAGDYLRETTLQPGYSYWIKVEGACSVGAAGGTGFVRLDSSKPNLTGPVLMDFADVPTSHPAYTAVGAMRWLSITTGCGSAPASFCPDSVVTRSQMAVFLTRLLRLPAPVQGKAVFRDVASNHWAFRYIQGLAQAGLTEGCAPGLFCPDLPVSRAQTAAFLTRALNLKASKPEAMRFEDVSPGYWAATQIAALAETGITQGCTETRFCPENPITRAELAMFFDRALRRLN